MTEGISTERMLIYIMVLCLLPIVYVAYTSSNAQTQLDSLLMRVDSVQERAYLHIQKLAPNHAVQAAFLDADRSYLYKHVESLSLLQSETAMIQKALSNPVVAPDPFLVNRLEALKKNTLQFSEGTVESYPFFKETPETVARAVEVDVDDIRRILSQLEGVVIGPDQPGPNRPQLIITDFKLDRKPTPRQGQVYSLSTLKLIKREYQ